MRTVVTTERRPRRVQVKWDSVLGVVRFCGPCNEWLPADADFFYLERRGDRSVSHCRACRAAAAKRSNQRLTEIRAERIRVMRAAARPVVIGPCPCAACRVSLTWDGRRWNDRRGKHLCVVRAA